LFYSNLSAGVWRIAAGGGPSVLVLDYLTIQPSLSSDGSHLAFKHIDSSTGRTRPVLGVARATGGPPVKMFEVPSALYSQIVRWRPDGALTYLTTEAGVRNLRVQPLDGSASTQITQFTSGLIWDYAWSRDGKRLALSRGTTTSDVVLITDER
jgi:Tol biopolymer transport system component